MKKFYTSKLKTVCVLFLVSLAASNALAAITTTVTMSGTPIGGSPFASFQAAITAVNALTITGPIVVDVPAGGMDTLTGKITLTATGTSTNTITIQKSGTGANPILTSYAGTVATPSVIADGFFVIAGGDYITIDGIDLQEAAGNITTTTVMEFGYGLFKASVTDGCQYNTIKNCTITLNRLQNTGWTAPGHNGSCGIAVLNSTNTAATALTPTASSGSNSFNKFYSNTIQNCNAGIVFVGFAATAGVGPAPVASTFLGDLNNDIGGTSASTGNTILNFGGASSAANPATGIFVNQQWSLNCSYNTINNNNGSGVNHVSTLRGIFLNSSSTSANVTCNNNNITIKGGATTSQVSGIECSFGATPAGNTVEISNNTITGSYLTATSGSFYPIYATACTPATLKINNNNIGNIEYSTNSLTGSGTVYPIYSTNSLATTAIEITNNNVHHINRYGTTGGTTIGIFQSTGTTGQAINIKNNIVKSLTISGAGTASTMYGIQASTGTIVIDSNTIDSLVCIKTTGTSVIYGIYDIASPVNENYNYNTISNLIHSGTGTVYGLYANSVAGTRNVIGNTISKLTGAGTTVAGLAMAASTPNIRGNKIYDISSTSAAAPTVTGILMTSLSSGVATIYNNLIGDIKAPAASSNIVTAPAVRGIGTIGVGSYTYDIGFNSIYLNASSTGTNFGSAGIFHTGNATATLGNLLMRNNNIVNASTPVGTGYTVAFQRSSTALNNFDVASNRNNFYAGTGGASNLIYFDGTNADITLAAYQSRVTAREAASVSENPSFVSTTSTSSDFLKIDVTTPTQLESGAVAITGVTTDFAGNSRNATTPDIGAFEFAGTTPAPAFANMSSSPALTTACVKSNRAITIDITTAAGTISSATLNYAHNGVAQTAVTMTNSTGNTWTGTMTAPTTGNDVVTWSITSVNSLGLSSTYIGASFSDEPNTGITATASATAASACAGSPDTLRVALSKPINATIGNGSTTIASATGNPYRMGAGSTSHRLQYLISGAELTAAGLKAGDLTSLTMNTTTASTTGSISSYEIKMAHTATTNMTTTFLTPTFTTLFLNTTGLALTTPGANTHTFSTPFTWNGVDNVVMEICYVTVSGGSPTVLANPATGISTPTIHATAATNCIATTGTTTTNRPQFIFAGQGAPVPTAHQWILNNTTNVATTNPYPFTVLAGSNDYKDSMTLNNCPLVSNTVTIDTIVGPFTATTVTSSLTPAFCAGKTSVLSVNASGGCIPYTYAWTGGGTTPTINVTTSGTYQVIVTDASGAKDTADITITVNPLPTLAIVPSLASVCGSKPAQLDVDPLVGTSSYQWSVTGSTSVANIYTNSSLTTPFSAGGGGASTVWVKPTGRTSYTVTVTDNNSCTASASRTVNIFDSISRYKIADPALLCTGGSSQLIDSPWMRVNITHSSFAASSATYTPITVGGGATDITSALTLGNTSVDDAALDSIPIGFTFGYRDSNWTQVAVSTNGFIVPHSTVYTATLVTNGLDVNAGIIAPFWDDNNIDLGTVLYQTTGTAPNRVFTIQWTGMHTGTAGSATNPTIDAQVKLYEGSNSIEFHYGPSSAALVGTTASIGISGSLGQYLSLDNSTSAAFASSTINTTGIATAATNGQRYVFTPIASSNFTHAWTNSLGGSGATFSSTTIYNPIISGFNGTENYIDSIYETNSGCFRLDTLTVTNAGGAMTINSILSSAGNTFCVGKGTVLDVDHTGGCGPYTYTWSDDPSFSAAPLANTKSFSVTPSTTTTYYVSITDFLSASVSNATTGGHTITINNPTPTVTGQSKCRTSDSFVLGAASGTVSPTNILNWYTTPTGGSIIASGGNYKTPLLTTTTNYYVDETERSGQTTGLGKLDNTGGTNANIATATYGIVFTLNKRAVIDSVSVYMAHTAATRLKISLVNNSGVTTHTKYIEVPAGNATTPVKHTIPLDFIVEPGTGYRLIKDSASGTLVRQTTGISYPYAMGAFGSVTSSCWTCRGLPPSIQSAQYIYFFNLALSDAGCTGSRVGVQATLVPPPVVNVTASPSAVCSGDSARLTAAIASTGYTYSWNPGGMNGDTVNVVTTNSSTFAPNVTNYIVTATNTTTNCIATASVPVTVNPRPTFSRYSLKSIAHCIADTNRMIIASPGFTIKDYGFTISTGDTLSPMTGATDLVLASTDDVPMTAISGSTTTAGNCISLPFNFKIGDSTYSFFGASPDGWLFFSNSTNPPSSDFSNGVTDNTNIPKLYPYWDDLATGTTGSVSYVVNGTTPNRIMVVNWFVTIPRNTTGAANSSFQIWLYESSGNIEYRYGTMGSATMSASIGATQNTTSYHSLNTALNASSTTTATNTITAQPSSGTKYTFIRPGVITKSWSPITNLFTNSIATNAYSGAAGAFDTMYSINSASQIYTATMTNTYGCANDTTFIDSVRTASTSVSLPASSVSGGVAQCTEGGWTYYGTAGDPSKWFFAIEKGSSPLSGESVAVHVSDTVHKKMSSSGTNQEHASYLMRRGWDVTATTQPGVTNPVKIRFFYNPADSASVDSLRNLDSATVKTANASSLLVKTPFSWFKTNGTQYNDAWRASIVGNRFPASHITLTPAAYGTINGINYAEFHGITSFSGGTGGAGFGAPGAGGGVGLPVTWAGFDVKTAEVGNELTWKTASEKNTDYFEVQYSYDANEFISLSDHIAAAGNSADLRTYNFTHSDFAPFVYYRIKQVDLDGKFDYSVIKLAKRAAGPSFVVNVFPVPLENDNIVNVSVKGVDKSPMTIKLTDVTGKVIRFNTITPANDMVKESFDMSPLTPGVYFIEVQNGQGKETIKVSR
jgi:Ig-like domain CHU_C associated/Secretion system C-terminal sorting domain